MKEEKRSRGGFVILVLAVILLAFQIANLVTHIQIRNCQLRILVVEQAQEEQLPQALDRLEELLNIE